MGNHRSDDGGGVSLSVSFKDSSGTVDDAITRDGRFGLQWTKLKKKKTYIYIYGRGLACK